MPDLFLAGSLGRASVSYVHGFFQAHPKVVRKAALVQEGMFNEDPFRDIAKARRFFQQFGIERVDSTTQSSKQFRSSPFENREDLLQRADAILVGGNNIDALVDVFTRDSLGDIVRNRVESGVPFMGWGAGSDVSFLGMEPVLLLEEGAFVYWDDDSMYLSGTAGATLQSAGAVFLPQANLNSLLRA